MLNELTISVRPVKEKELKAIISALCTKENEEYAFYADALYITPETQISLSCDCCYSYMLDMYFNGKVQPVYQMPVKINTRTEGGWSMPSQPDFYYPISIEDMEKNFLDEPVSLKTYMGSRYNYNPRVTGNMRKLIEFINDRNEALLEQNG